MTPTFADRMQNLGTETAFEVLVRAKALEASGRHVIHLEIGEPDFQTPPNIVEAGIRALRDGLTRYGPSAGLPELREAICESLWTTRRVRATPDQVVVTPGAKPIIFFGILATVNPGDEVLLPDPGFPIYESVVRFVGGVPVPVPLLESNGFALDLAALERLATPRTRLLIFNSPANPTGGVIPPADIERIAAFAERRDLWVMADEIYSQILYEGTHASIAALPGLSARTILIDGFSKTYAMTGWRLGYGVMPAPLAAHVTRLVVNSNSCTAGFVQAAGVEALRGPQEASRAMVAEFRARRDLIVARLNEIPGIRCALPQGAFYAFPNVSGLPVDARAFADRLLERHGVAALAGTCFGAGGDGYLRLSYANSTENLLAAADRIDDAVRSLSR
ncbi:MAG TPA: pyridoxal phosphate-dependent aminotransferase [Thermodesulfobacteriota bacterium]